MPAAAAVQTDVAVHPPEVQVAEILISQLAGRLVHLAAALKLPDHLADGPRSAEELASHTATYAPALYRVMRTLASLGFFTEDAEHRFSLLPLGAVLKSGTPSYAVAVAFGGEMTMRGLDEFLYSVQTGKAGFERAYGAPLFDWLGTHPEEAALYSQAMVGFNGMEPPAIAAAYDFSVFRTIADLGGSTGNMLATILTRHPGPQGILFDLPHVVEKAPALLQQRGVADRIRIEAGSFFECVPVGADAYILSHVIHDWNHEQCLTILGNCRRAMNSNSRLLLAEMVLPEGDTPHPGKMLDMVMLIMPGGEERTALQYGALLDEAGFRMTRVVPTASPVSIVEAVPR
ncbi:MAG TPA: methyltransferase [Acidobacteriaceae bacterium]|nr:methyltransferase [Acidobacteriaceae bacterium]